MHCLYVQVYTYIYTFCVQCTEIWELGKYISVLFILATEIHTYQGVSRCDNMGGIGLGWPTDQLKAGDGSTDRQVGEARTEL